MDESTHVIYNGETLEKGAAGIPLTNRAFRFGDGLFESIRIINGSPCFMDNHLNRIKQGVTAMKMEMTADYDWEKLERDLLRLIERNGVTSGGRARITISRSSEGYYRPKDDDGIDYLIEVYPHPDERFILNEKGVQIDSYHDMVKQINVLSRYKLLNCQLYIMASIHAKQKGIDNSLILNERDNIIEANDSNIFLVSNRVLYTPPLEDGCVGGTMRMEVINTALRHDIKVYETSLLPQNLLVADELFLTNAISGIRWVSSYRQKRYFNQTAMMLVDYLNESVMLGGEEEAES